MRQLRERGVKVQPIELMGQTIARSFWGRRWCDHLDTFSDYEDRLPRGRTFVRNGSVCHLQIQAGVVEAMVAGSALFHVVVRIPTIEQTVWTALGKACAGQISSIPALLQGRLPNHVIEAVTDPGRGLLPKPGEMELACGCNEGSGMCRHAAAALYGVGSRLDAAPELLFLLRGVDEAKLLADAAPAHTPPAQRRVLRAPADLAPVDLAPADLAPADLAPADWLPRTWLPRTWLPRTWLPRTWLAPADLADLAPADLAPADLAPADLAPADLAPADLVLADLAAAVPSPTPAPPDPGPAQKGAAAEFHPTGALIRRLRDISGFSVTEFAALLQVSAATVRRWEAVSGSLTLRSGPRDALQMLHDEIEGVGTDVRHGGPPIGSGTGDGYR